MLSGGSDPYSTRLKNEVSSEVWIFHPSDQTWQRAPDMIHCRKNFGLVGFKGKLYAIGGTDDHNKYSFVFLMLKDICRQNI